MLFNNYNEFDNNEFNLLTFHIFKIYNKILFNQKNVIFSVLGNYCLNTCKTLLKDILPKIYILINNLPNDYFNKDLIISLYNSSLLSINNECRRQGNTKKQIDFIFELFPILIYLIDIDKSINNEVLNLFKSTLFNETLLYSYELTITNKKVKLSDKKEKVKNDFISHSNQLFDKILELKLDNDNIIHFPQFVYLIYQAYIDRINEDNNKVEIYHKRKNKPEELKTSYQFAFYILLANLLYKKCNNIIDSIIIILFR